MTHPTPPVPGKKRVTRRPGTPGARSVSERSSTDPHLAKSFESRIEGLKTCVRRDFSDPDSNEEPREEGWREAPTVGRETFGAPRTWRGPGGGGRVGEERGGGDGFKWHLVVFLSNQIPQKKLLPIVAPVIIKTSITLGATGSCRESGKSSRHTTCV